LLAVELVWVGAGHLMPNPTPPGEQDEELEAA